MAFEDLLKVGAGIGGAFLPKTTGNFNATIGYSPASTKQMQASYPYYSQMWNKIATTPTMTPFQQQVLTDFAKNYTQGGSPQMQYIAGKMENMMNQPKEYFGPKTNLTSDMFLKAMVSQLGKLNASDYGASGGGYPVGGSSGESSSGEGTSYDPAEDWKKFFVGGDDWVSALAKLEEVEKATPQQAAMNMVGTFGSKLNQGTAIEAATEAIMDANLKAKQSIATLYTERAQAKDLAARFAEEARLKREANDAAGSAQSASMALGYAQLAADKDMKIASLLGQAGMWLGGQESTAAQYVPQVLNTLSKPYLDMATFGSTDAMKNAASIGNLPLENMLKWATAMKGSLPNLEYQKMGQTQNYPQQSTWSNLSDALLNPSLINAVPGAFSSIGNLLGLGGGSSLGNYSITPTYINPYDFSMEQWGNTPNYGDLLGNYYDDWNNWI